jgi:hypothetical protein
MFNNIDELYLWKIQSPSVKQEDSFTEKYEYLDEERGQTQRYLIAIGRIVKEVLNSIEDLYNVKNSSLVSKNTMEFILNNKNLNFLSALDESVLRDIYKNYEFNKKSRGTQRFFEWLVWKVLGWQVISVTSSLPENIIKFYDSEESENSYFYDSGETLNYVFFDGYATITIGLFLDPVGENIPEKKSWLESIVKEWLINSTIEYT